MDGSLKLVCSDFFISHFSWRVVPDQLGSMASSTLAVPGASSSALTLIVFPPNSGIEKLDLSFAAILTQNDVPTDHMEKLGNAGLNNYALSTVTPDLMRGCADYLRGERVWGYVVKDEAGHPVSCPSLNRVLGHAQSLRDLAWMLVRFGKYTSKGALEAAMADPDTRVLNSTTGFSMEANSAACWRLSAPRIQEIYANPP